MREQFIQRPGTRARQGWRIAALSMVSMVSMMSMAGCGDDPAALGTECAADPDCASGMCAPVDGTLICSEACTAGQACPGAEGSLALTCREGNLCGPSCAFSGAQDEYLCEPDGTVRACADGNDVADCAACGCSYFGGGRCVEGMGCIDPLPSGSPCTVDEMCASSLCNPESGACTSPLPNGSACSDDRYCTSGMCGAAGACITPAALGGSCREDRECQSGHCSTDGDTSMVGTCQITVGNVCGTLTSSFDANCDICRQAGFTNVCFREDCNDTNATCPSGWTCRSTTGGGSACFQRCDRDRPFTSCLVSSAQCQSDGVCSRSF